MTKTEVKRYIDKLVKRARELDELTHEEITLPSGHELSMCNQISTTYMGSSVPYVHIYSGLREMAEIMGWPLKEEEGQDRLSNGTEYIKISTYYKGVILMQLEEKA